MSNEQSTDSVKLRPCPFCGGEAEIWRAHPENPKRSAWIACMSRCGVLTKEYETNDEAIAAWNTRATDDLLDALENAADHMEYCQRRRQATQGMIDSAIRARATIARH